MRSLSRRQAEWRRSCPGYLVLTYVSRRIIGTGRPISDMTAYIDKLYRFVFRSGLVRKPVFSTAKTSATKRVIFTP